MSYAYESEFENRDVFAIDAVAEERATFIRKTYLHLAAAILAFVGLETVFLNTDIIVQPMLKVLMSGQWWMIMLGFIAVGWVAEKWAQSETSPAVQYLGLALYTVAEAVIFVPLLLVVQRFGGPDTISIAAILTLVLFGGLTAFVLITGADFSFLRTGLCLAGLAAFAIAICAAIFGFSLGLWYSAAMVVLASGYIVYYTSQVLHTYRTNQYVAASLALFSAVALLFWYILRIVSELRRN
jgi:FtsH-binding integral membrane protein